MNTITFACPDCRTNLKTARRIASDQDVRCPKCGTIFPAPPETDSELLEPGAETTGISSEPAPSIGQSWAEDRSPRPRSSRAPGAANRTRRLILASCVIVLVFTAATAYFAWSAVVNRGRNAGSGREIPLAYVPADSTLVLGINLGQLADQPAWRDQLEKAIRSQDPAPGFLDDCKTHAGIERSELFDQVILAFKLDGLNPNEPPHTTLIAKSKAPFDQTKIRDSEEEMYPDIAEGKFYYKRRVGHILDLDYLFMPSDRILILSNLPQFDFETLVEKDGTEPFLSEEILTMMRGLQSEPLWAILPFHDTLRRNLHRHSQAVVKTNPETALVLETLSRSHAATGRGRWDGDQLALTVSLVCAEETAATKALTCLQTYWEKHSKGWVGLLPMLPKDRQELFQDLVTHAEFSKEGPTVQLAVKLSRPSAETLVKLLPGQPWNLGGARQLPAPPMIPPGMLPPGRRGPGGPGPGGVNLAAPRKV
jgi:hypothetical protein